MRLSRLLSVILFLATLGWSSVSFGQVKVGTNPTVIGTNSNLEVEAANGNKTVIQKDNGNVGVGTSAPGNKLEIDQGAAGNSGLRFRQINNSTTPVTTNIAPLGVNGSGDVVVIQNNSSTVLKGTVTVGDVNQVGASSLPVSGYISSASKQGSFNGTQYVNVVNIDFPTLGTSDYIVNITLESATGLGGGYNVSLITSPVVLAKTPTGFNVYLREAAQYGQDIILNIAIVK